MPSDPPRQSEICHGSEIWAYLKSRRTLEEEEGRCAGAVMVAKDEKKDKVSLPDFRH